MFDLAELNKQLEFSFFTAAYGQLRSCPLTIKDEKELKKRIGRRIDGVSPDVFVKGLASVTCIVEPEQGGCDEKEDYQFSLAQMSQLTDEEQEKFARKYLEKNKKLLTGPDSKEDDTGGENEEGRETPLTYVGELYEIYQKNEKKQEDLIAKTFPTISDYMSDIGATVSNLNSMGGAAQRLSDMMSSTAQISPINRTAEVKPFDIRPLPPIRTFDHSLLDALAPVTRQLEASSELTLKMSQSIMDMANDNMQINEHTAKNLRVNQRVLENAEKTAKSNRKMTIWIIIISLLSLVFMVFTYFISIKVADRQEENRKKHLEKIVKTFEQNQGKLLQNESIAKEQMIKIMQEQNALLRDLKVQKNNNLPNKK